MPDKQGSMYINELLYKRYRGNVTVASTFLFFR